VEWTVSANEARVRLDKFLAAADRLGSRAKAGSALERGKVLVNGVDQVARDGSRRLAAGDVVRVWQDRPGSARRPLGTIGGSDLRIVYEDASLLVLNKPAGLLAVPLDARPDAASVYDRIEDRLRSHGKKPFIVHRIDRDTSGLVVFARDAQAQAALKAQFRRREPERVYWAVVHGHPDPPEGTWRDYLVWDEGASIQKSSHARDPRAQEAISDYRVLETFDAASLLEVRLQTGKRNQIRIQAGLRGYALVGERRYVFGPDREARIPFPRQALHAHRLSFLHPDDERVLRFEAPLPGDMRKLLAQLREPLHP
jgi:23S rRNA pseudouridine1911/1915/1917 synthase